MADWARDWVSSNAVLYGDAPALQDIDTGAVQSWRQLEEDVARLAGLLHGRFDVRRGDRAVVLAEGDPWIFRIMFACMRLGAIMVPLNWRLTQAELMVLAADVEPKVVLHDGVWQASAVHVAESVGAPLAGWRCADTPCDLDEAVGSASPISGQAARQRLTDPVMILHTSGTTGQPKGAIVTSATLAWQTLNTSQEALMTGPGAKQLNPLPLFHAGGLTTVSAPMLRTGGCVAISRRFDPDQVIDYMSRPDAGVTHITLPPVMYQYLTETSRFAVDRWPTTLRWAQVAGGVPSSDLLCAWRSKDVVLQQAYGGTELGPAVTTMPRSAVADRPTSCGRAVPYTSVRLVAADGSDAAHGDVGEVWISGPSVTPGYWRRSHADAFVDGWFRTGDAARRDSDGYYYLVDRIKDMYKSGGENVYPAEVERVLAEHPDLVEVAVVGVPDERWGEVGRVFVVVAPGRSTDLASLHAWCDGRLARYKMPKSLVILDAPLPRNTTGKVQKADLRSWAD